jgi:HNH endonuclease
MITIQDPGEEAAPVGDGPHTGPIAGAALDRHTCDGVLRRVRLAPSGGVLDLGRAVRVATPAQRAALAARDGGCVIPTCIAPPAACEAHHVRHWRHGGSTDLANLALLCGRHHDTVHAGIWTLHMRDGVPWAVPPPWIDRHQQPIRRPYSAVTEAHHLARQLRLPWDGATKELDDG